jgi:dynein heavy chain
MLIGDLTPGDRQKIMTICTIDVHARDVVAAMVLKKVNALICQNQAFFFLLDAVLNLLYLCDS